HQRMGDISLELGQTEAALEQYQQAQKIMDTVAAADPENDAVLYNWAVLNDKLGFVYRQLLGDTAVARDYYRKSLELGLVLSKMPLKAPQLKPEMVKERLVSSYVDQANLALRLGDPVAAWQFYQKSVELEHGQSVATPRDALALAKSSLPKAGSAAPAF